MVSDKIIFEGDTFYNGEHTHCPTGNKIVSAEPGEGWVIDYWEVSGEAELIEGGVKVLGDCTIICILKPDIT